MKANFDKALHFTLTWEGGYSDNPNDPGGATMEGITQRVYDGYRMKMFLARQAVKDITPLEVRTIYAHQYWDVLDCDNHASPLDEVLFDCAVNNGPGHAKAWLLRAKTENPTADGLTLAKRIIDYRVEFYEHLGKYPKMHEFLKGWLARSHALKVEIGY